MNLKLNQLSTFDSEALLLDRGVALGCGISALEKLNRSNHSLFKLLLQCAGSAASAAIVLSASPAYAAGQQPVLIDPNSSATQALPFEPNALLKLDQASQTPILAGSDRVVLGEAVSAVSIAKNDEAAPDKAPHHAPPQALPTAVEQPAHSAQALAEPIGASAELLIEPAESGSIDPVAQVDVPDLQPAEPTSELEPLEPAAEPTSELEPPEPAAEPEPEPAESSELAPSRRWQFSLAPYFFAPFDVQADVTVAGRSASLDLGLDDVLNFDRAFDAGLRLEGRNDRWSIILDGFYLYGEDSGTLGRTFSSGSIFQFVQQTSPGRLDTFVQQFEPQQIQRFVQIGRQIGLNTPIRVSADGTVSVRQILVDAAVSYRAVDVSLSDSPEEAFYPRLVVAPLLGVRTNFLRQTIEVDTIRINDTRIPDQALPEIDREFRFSRTLVEPLLGTQIELALSERWAFGLRGDVSGFGIGADRNFTWNLLVSTQYNLSRSTALQLAYRFNHFDFEDGEGLRRARLNLDQNGLLLSVLFRF